MSLWGSPKDFDRNDDGHLGYFEYNEWYSAQYGMDIEMDEHRRQAEQEQEYRQMLAETAAEAAAVFNSFIAAARAILAQWNDDTSRLAGKAAFFQICAGLRHSGRLEYAFVINAGEFVSGYNVKLYYDVLQSLAEHYPGICTRKKLVKSISKGSLLFEQEAAISHGLCGTFWTRVIDALPPFNYGLYSPELDELLSRAGDCFGLLAYDEKEAREHYEALVNCFQEHWIRRGTPVPNSAAATAATRQQNFRDNEQAYRKQNVGKRPTAPDCDGKTYRYCMVRFPKAPRSYSYLTEDASIQAGDWVLAPFGRENMARAGQVEQVSVCTAATAPYPPERTKHIIGKTEKGGHDDPDA